MNINSTDLQKIFNKEILNKKIKIDNVSINSKEINAKSIFFAIKGKNTDGQPQKPGRPRSHAPGPGRVPLGPGTEDPGHEAVSSRRVLRGAGCHRCGGRV